MKACTPARRWRIAGAFGLGLALPLVAFCLPTEAAPKKGQWGRTAAQQQAAKSADAVLPEESEDEVTVQPPPTIRINHLRSSWSKVIADYADAVGKEVVADAVPKGYFTRVDPRSHAPKVALGILNRDLEPLGYRLIEKGKFVVLISIKQARKEYQAAVIPAEDEQPNERNVKDKGNVEHAADEQPVKRRMQSHSIRPRQVAAADEETQVDLSPPAPRKPSAQEPSPAARKPSAQQPSPVRTAEPPEAEAETTLTTVRLKARDAVSVSKTIYKAFKAHAELIDRGPRGLEGFRVFRIEVDKHGKALERGANQLPRFAIYIDDDRNQLVVEAGPQETPAVLRLIRMLDRQPDPARGAVRAIPTSKDAGQIAEALQPELERLVLETRKATRHAQRTAFDGRRLNQRAALDDDGDLEDVDPRAANRGAGDEPGEGEAMEGEPEAPDGLMGSLKGDVSVEAVPELGILILRGNLRDVEAVRAVIDEIERLSVASVPQLELLMLRYVSSESLAPLLTSVYDRIGSTRTRGAQAPSSSILPIVRPNAILIIASEAEIGVIKELAEKLDQPSDPASEFRVFRLRHAVATQVVETLEGMYGQAAPAAGQQAAQPAQPGQAATDRNLSPRVRVFPDLRTNSIVIVAQPRDMREVHRVIQTLDTEEVAAVSQIKIFQLKSAVADELAASLQSAIQSVLTPARITLPTGQQGGGAGGFGGAQQGGAGQGQAAPELREVRSQILEFLGKDGSDERLRSGILADIRISSDARTNSIVVTAPEQSMDLVAALIRRFDQPAAAVAEIKVFSLAKSDATSMQTLLERLFNVQSAQRAGQGGQGAQGGGFGQNIPGLQIGDASDASSTVIPLRFSTDIRTNSVIAIGGAEALRVVEAVLYRLDESDIRQRKNNVYRLRNSYAPDVAAAIQNFLQTQRQVIQQTDPELISPFEQIEREVIVVAEAVTNSLLISATPRYYDDVMDLVYKLDAMPKQVIIQLLIVEVTLENQDEWGVELGLQDSVLFDRSLLSNIQLLNTTTTLPQGTQTTTQTIVSQQATPGFTFNNQPFGNNSTRAGTDPHNLGGQGLTNFNLQRINGDLGYGGLVLSAGSDSVNLLLRALSARRRVDVLSLPQIRTLDNQIAQIQVGQEIPRVNGFQINNQTGNAAPLIQQRAIGIILQVTPRISPEGMVVMEIVARKDALSPNSIPLFVNPNGSTVNSPIVDTTNALTTVGVRTGQTVVLGGMITKRDENTERKVPLLGDIPIIGQAFRYDFKHTLKTELLIFLTPRVVHNDAEAELIKEIETQRINFIEAEAEAIHGPLFGVPAEPEWSAPGAPTKAPSSPASPPSPPVPDLSVPTIPMSHLYDDDPTIPTTNMPAEPLQVVPLSDENLDIDLSRARRQARRDGAVVPAGGVQADTDVPGSPGRASLARRNAAASAPLTPGRRVVPRQAKQMPLKVNSPGTQADGEMR